MELTQEQKDHAAEQLNQMVGLLGFEAEIAPAENGSGFGLNLKTAEPGRLIGRKGHCLQSLELLLNRMLRRKYKRVAWVEIDVDGYQRKSRPKSSRQPSADDERLRNIALDAAKEVKRWGQPKRIGPFSARDRRTIHVVLREDTEIDTESCDPETNGMKKVVIRLAGKDAE